MSDIVISDWSKLGSTIRAQRLRLELSQAETAERANVSRSWLARVEGGHRGAELEQVMRLLNALSLMMVLRAPDAGGRPDDRASQEIVDRHREKAVNRRRAWSDGFSAAGEGSEHG
jgi:HTH-type transcriptional regulator/antitoxin HipB